MKHGKLKPISHANRRSVLNANKTVKLHACQKGDPWYLGAYSRRQRLGNQSESSLISEIEKQVYNEAIVREDGYHVLDLSEGRLASSRRVHGRVWRATDKLNQSSSYRNKRRVKRAVRAIKRARDKYRHEQRMAKERAAFFGG